jgi:tRNA-Thr(GGU) m(6)t(6)A37 methyltransferase TsaA
MNRLAFFVCLCGLVSPCLANEHLPQPRYERQPSDPAWLVQVVQVHGHLGSAVVAGARMGMTGLRAVDAKGFFDVEVTCEGPLAKPPRSCFLDGVQAGTGATLGKRNLRWVQSERIVLRIKNTETGKMAELRPTPMLLNLLAWDKPEPKIGGGTPPHEHLEGVARKIALIPEKELVTVTGDETNLSKSSQILMKPIGIVHSPFKESKGTPIQGVFDKDTVAWIELEDKYVRGLKDLDTFSHAILLYHFHKSDREEIVSKPYLENEEHGIFAIRSPHRPNHIGLSVVRIKRIEGNRVYFSEVDVLDGTPVLDIKPYVKEFDSRPDARSGWIEKHMEHGKTRGPTTAP